MARTLAQLKSLINSKTAQQTLSLGESDYLANLNASLDELTAEVDMPETEKVATPQPLFRDVSHYAVPSDMKGDAILEIRPYVELPYNKRDTSLGRNSGTEFSRNLLWEKAEGKYAIEFDNGTKKLRILPRLSSVENVALHDCDTYDGNGTWVGYEALYSDATNIRTDNVNYFEGSGSVAFDVDVSQSAGNTCIIYNTTFTPVDVSSLTNPYLFAYVYIPDATNVTSLRFYVSSDDEGELSLDNYYTLTATTQFDGSAFVSGRNLIGIQVTSSTQTGTVDTSSIQYIEFNLNYSASQTDMSGVRLDGIYMREGELHQIRYYTSNIVSSAAGTKKQYFTLEDDYLTVNPEGEMLFVTKAAAYIAPNVKDNVTGQTNAQMYEIKKRMYQSRYPSKRKMMVKNWYYR